MNVDAHSSTTGSSGLKAEARSVKKAPKAAPVSAHRCTRTSMPLTVAYHPRQRGHQRRRRTEPTLSLGGGPAERSTVALALSISAMRAYLDFCTTHQWKLRDTVVHHRTCQYLTPRYVRRSFPASCSIKAAKSSVVRALNDGTETSQVKFGLSLVNTVAKSSSPTCTRKAPGWVGAKSRTDPSRTCTATNVCSLGGTPSKTPAGGLTKLARELIHPRSGTKLYVNPESVTST